MLILVLLGSAGGVYAEPLRDGELKIAAPSAVLMEKETGELLYEKGAHERRPPASVTKVMTLLLIIEDIENGKISAEETLVPCGLESGCRYARRPGTGKIVNGFYKLTLGPACQAAARIAR